MTRTLRLGMVGCGAIAQWHKTAIDAVDSVEISAAIDVDTERAEAMAKAVRDSVIVDRGTAPCPK